MMDHSEERRQTSHWETCQRNIVNYLRDVWELDFSKEEINHVIGLIEVNAFEIKLGQKTKEDYKLGLNLYYLSLIAQMDSNGAGRGVFSPLYMSL